jgi:hypothetical protein
MASTQKQKTTSGGSVAGSSNERILGSIARVGFWWGSREESRKLSRLSSLSLRSAHLCKDPSFRINYFR